MSNRARSREFVRNFPQNGMKLLLEVPVNVRELLQTLRYVEVDRIEFDEMTVERTTFVASDYRHLEADIVLTAPFRIDESPQSRKRITLYILIEHQSKPDRFIVCRVLEYVVQIYKSQLREWRKQHGNCDDFEFQPVLPIVFYTGTRQWKRLKSMSALMAGGTAFGKVLPKIKPLFLNLKALSDEHLHNPATAFASILDIVRNRTADPAIFRQRLVEAVTRCNELEPDERDRWFDFLNYLAAFTYNYRSKEEHNQLLNLVEATMPKTTLAEEIRAVFKTGAEVAREEGELKALRKTLRRQLNIKFKSVPESVIRRIRKEEDRGLLESWLDNVVKSKRFADVGIPIV